MDRHLPTEANFVALCSQGNLVPVYREVICDGETPVSAFAKLGGAVGSFLLESVVGGEKWAAYSFIGVGARKILRISDERGEDPAEIIKRELAAYRPVVLPELPRFFGGAVGYFAYDYVRSVERLERKHPDELGLPIAQFVIPDVLLIFDNLRQTVKIVYAVELGDGVVPVEAYRSACARIDAALEKLMTSSANLAPLDLDAAPSKTGLVSNTTRAAYVEAVARAKEYILAGDAFQVVLSQRFSAPSDGLDPFDVYRALRVVNPSPYMFHLRLPDVTVTGASPEVLVRLVADRIEVRPIAGTRPRGKTPDEDAALETALRADIKENAEHVMLIDLARNDVGRVAATGTVRVDEERSVERYSHVMHLVSSVSGELKLGCDAYDVLRACFPAGTLTGAPKVRAMQIIDELEPSGRGLYGGAVGYLSFTGNMDFAIAIRTLVSTKDHLFLQAGAGIVADSVPDAEFDETVAKARAVARSIEMARGAKTAAR